MLVMLGCSLIGDLSLAGASCGRKPRGAPFCWWLVANIVGPYLHHRAALLQQSRAVVRGLSASATYGMSKGALGQLAVDASFRAPVPKAAPETVGYCGDVQTLHQLFKRRRRALCSPVAGEYQPAMLPVLVASMGFPTVWLHLFQDSNGLV